ncbi:MAG: hypothetical protein JWQ49_2314 [Edaphobacter sp.]|nr:hypothetical protein [Edaphobacter sp.]
MNGIKQGAWRKKHNKLPAPTPEEFAQYRGGHTNKLWGLVGRDWQCPSCKRNKFEQLTWTIDRRKSVAAIPVYGWLAPIHEHHDHGADEGLRSQRFPPTHLCFDCNNAEGRIKKTLKLPSDFSFSPDELSLFITGHPHRRVTEDIEAAKRIADGVLRFRLF